MPWVKATDPMTGHTPWLNVDAARRMAATPDGTQVIFSPDDIVTVQEDCELLASISRAHWVMANRIDGEALWINTDAARKITVGDDGTEIAFDEADYLTVRETCDVLIGARSRRPRMR